jgi:putative mRNA 3-end processing factor
MPQKGLLQFTSSGIYCPEGDFFIDPWKPVPKAIITHGHSDHARWGHSHYLCHTLSYPILRLRLGEDCKIETLDYNKPLLINGVKVSFHPAGHIIGSAMIRVEFKGEVWVASGDYKTEYDGIAHPLEVVKCHSFISETTFGLPIFQWEPQKNVFQEINEWWENNNSQNLTSIIFGYTLGKAQRILTNIDTQIGKIFAHGAIANMNEVLIQAGLSLPVTQRFTSETAKNEFPGSLVIAPPSAIGTPWMNKFRPFSTAIASGWMTLRGARRRKAADRGFILSDHADFQGLINTIKATGAENIYLTHGYTAAFARYLREIGYNAQEVQTNYGAEDEV